MQKKVNGELAGKSCQLHIVFFVTAVNITKLSHKITNKLPIWKCLMALPQFLSSSYQHLSYSIFPKQSFKNSFESYIYELTVRHVVQSEVFVNTLELRRKMYFFSVYEKLTL